MRTEVSFSSLLCKLIESREELYIDFRLLSRGISLMVDVNLKCDKRVFTIHDQILTSMNIYVLQ